MFKPSALTILSCTLFLSGCLFAPGMQMRMSPAPSLNGENEIIKPRIVKITAELVKNQRILAKKLHEEAVKNYQSPPGFSVETTGYNYRVGAQDVLNIVVWDYPNLSMEEQDTTRINQLSITIDSEGFIYYPYVGYLKVIDKTTNEIRDLLTQNLAQFIKNPQVNVSVVQFNSQKVYVTGAVHVPQTISVNNVPLTVLTAVTKSGGPIRCGINTTGGNTSLCADLKNVEVSKGNKHTVLDLDSLVAIDGSPTNWILEDGDKVYIPSNNPYRVFVLGSVLRPGPYPMTDGHMSLREALGNAHGVTTMSNPAYTYVIRNYNRNPEIFLLDADSPDAFNLAGDFDLKGEDVVFVSASKMETFNSLLGQVNPSLITAVSTKALMR